MVVRAGDLVLNGLEEQVDAANPSLAAAVASFDQARAYSAKAASALLPHVDLNNTFTANKESQHRPTRKSNTPFSAAGYLNELTDNRPLNEPDHYGNNLLTLQHPMRSTSGAGCETLSPRASPTARAPQRSSNRCG